MWTATQAKITFIEWAAVVLVAIVALREVWDALSPLLVDLRRFWDTL